MCIEYSRSTILSLYELTDDQAKQAVSDFCLDAEPADEMFVLLNDYAIPLSAFLKIDNPVWHGAHGLSYFNAYYIRLSRDNSEAVVAHRAF